MRLLLTHGGVAIPIRATLEGVPDGMEVLRGFKLDNCQVKEYELWKWNKIWYTVPIKKGRRKGER